jgi:hypothetical protein
MHEGFYKQTEKIFNAQRFSGCRKKLWECLKKLFWKNLLKNKAFSNFDRKA